MQPTRYEEEVLECCRTQLRRVTLDADSNLSYLVSVAVQEFLGGPERGYHIAKVPFNGADHHWVINAKGADLDALADKFKEAGKPRPYRGRKPGKRATIGKRNTIQKHLPLLEAIRAEMGRKELEEAVRELINRPLLARGAPIDKRHAIKALTEANRALVADWAGSHEEFLRTYFSKGMLAVQFVRAMLFDEEIPRTATMAYTADRYYVAGSSRPFNEMLPTALKDDRILRGIIFGLAGDVGFSKLIASNLPIGGYRMPFDFPISLAKRLINKYCPEDGVVLDPCHGWGGRLVGFMLSHAYRYTGIDPAPHSHKLREMFDDLSKYLPEPQEIKLINKPFEDVRLPKAGYDFALTSPPYFNTEKYLGEESSWRRYKTLDGWIDGFYRALIVGVADALKPGAFFALQVTPKLGMVSAAKEIGAEVNLEFESIEDTTMKRYNSASADRAGSSDTYEVIAIFRRK